MSSSSPKPIAHRAFSVLLASLLVGGLIAPIAATQPAAAASGDTINIQEDCGAVAKFAFPRSCHAAEMAFGDPDVDQSDIEATKVDIHVGMQGVHQNLIQRESTYQNYLQDTETLASLEARNAIADAYENNESAIAAQAAGQRAINDYYAQHQSQILDMVSADVQEMIYYANITKNNPDISDGMINWAPRVQEGSLHSSELLAEKVESNYTLVNQSEESYYAPRIHAEGETHGGFGQSGTTNATVSNYNDGAFTVKSVYDGTGGPQDFTVNYPGSLIIINVPSASLETQEVYDMGMVYDRLAAIDEQAQTVQANYDQNAAEDLYAAMDAGRIDPNDVRGAEGMVRYMSGADGNNVTEDRFNYALRSTLDLASTDLNQTMTVHFEGATERTRNVTSDGSVSYDYNSVNQTYEGLLFSSETPDGGFQTGQTYNVNTLNGTTSMVHNGGADEVTFYRGNLTIQAIYDQSGNEVQNVTWSDPKYDSYDASEFLAALENASAARSEIVSEEESGGGNGGLTLPDNPFGVGAGGAIVGLVVIVAAAGVIVAVVIRP